MVSLVTFFLLVASASAERAIPPKPVEAVRRFEAPRWQTGGDMPKARWSLAAEVLRDGRVLAFGGGPSGNDALADAALYDAATGRWTETSSLPQPRYAVISATLKDGRVLAIGGYPDANGADVYDPATGAWTPTGPLAGGRYRIAVTLQDGRVLAAARSVRGKPVDDSFLFDPKTNAWWSAGRMNEPRSESRGVLLRGGKVLACGGFGTQGNLASCELFDPTTGNWSFAAPMSRPRFGHSLTVMADGRVVAAGGPDAAAAEVYDPKRDRWSVSRDVIAARLYHEAVLQPDGRVMLVGGYDTRRRLQNTEVYDALLDSWRAGPMLAAGRSDFVLLQLGDARLLAIGGQGNQGPIAETELLGAFPDWNALSVIAPVHPAPRRAEVVAPTDAPAPAVRPPAVAQPAISFSGPRRRDGEKDLAVVVGVDRYRALPAADFAERDAASFASALTGPLGLPEENVIRLIGSRATRTDIAKYIEEWLPRNVEPDSRVYFYFSGHGAPDQKSGAAHLVPWDGDPTFLQSSAYPLEKLYASLAKLPAREVIVVLDSCFSGAGGRSVLAAGTRPLVTRVSLPKPKGRLSILTASAGDEITGSLSGGGHGLFTYHLLQGLGGEADKDADGHVKLSELHGFVKAKVQRAARRQNREQTPQLIAPDPALPVY